MAEKHMKEFCAALSAGYVIQAARSDEHPDPVTKFLVESPRTQFLGIFADEAPSPSMQKEIKVKSNKLGVPEHRQNIHVIRSDGETASIRAALLETHTMPNTLSDIEPEMGNDGYVPVSGRHLIYCAPNYLSASTLREEKENMCDLDNLLPTLIVVITSVRPENFTEMWPVGKLIVGSTPEETKIKLQATLDGEESRGIS